MALRVRRRPVASLDIVELGQDVVGLRIAVSHAFGLFPAEEEQDPKQTHKEGAPRTKARMAEQIFWGQLSSPSLFGRI